jgi:hypothetical protein
MKKISTALLCGLSLLALTQFSHAGASNKNGDPFGNGTFFSTTGTFSAVIRGTDLIGITQFSTGVTTTLTGGPLYIYDATAGNYNDDLGVYATMDPSANTINALILPAPVTEQANPTNSTVFTGGGSFNAALSVTPPNQTLNGNGVLSQIVNTETAPATTVNRSFSISGVRIAN